MNNAQMTVTTTDIHINILSSFQIKVKSVLG